MFRKKTKKEESDWPVEGKIYMPPLTLPGMVEETINKNLITLHLTVKKMSTTIEALGEGLDLLNQQMERQNDILEKLAMNKDEKGYELEL